MKKAHEKTYFKRPAYYYSVGVLIAWFSVACGGDGGGDIPTTKGVNNAPTLNLPDTMKFDLKNHPTIADFNKELLKLVSDDNTSKDKLTIETNPNPDLTHSGTTNTTITVSDNGKDSKWKIWEKKSSTAKTVVKVSDTRKLEIPTNDLSEYKNPECTIFDEGKVDWRNLANKMGLTNVRGLLKNVIKDSGKKVSVLEIAESPSHKFKHNMKKIIKDTGVKYKWQELTKDEKRAYNENTKKFLENAIKNSDFAVFELNRDDKRNSPWSEANVGDILEAYHNNYTSAAGWCINYEKISNEKNLKVSLAGFYHTEHKKYYIHDHNKYSDPDAHPIKNDIDSRLFVGINFWSTSGAAAANAATWAVASKLLFDMGIEVDWDYFNEILENKTGEYDDLFEDAYYVYKDENWENIYTNKIVGKVFILQNLINHFNFFDLNPEIANLQAGQQFPLMKNHDRIKPETIIIASEKAIVYKDGIPYIDYDLGKKQGLDMETFKKNIATELKFLVGDKSSKTFYWKNY